MEDRRVRRCEADSPPNALAWRCQATARSSSGRLMPGGGGAPYIACHRLASSGRGRSAKRPISSLHFVWRITLRPGRFVIGYSITALTIRLPLADQRHTEALLHGGGEKPTLCGCQPVARQIAGMVVPSSDPSSAMMAAPLVAVGPPGTGSGSLLLTNFTAGRDRPASLGLLSCRGLRPGSAPCTLDDEGCLVFGLLLMLTSVARPAH